jgi:tetratricopeptide (TPR) repeat protein
VFLIVFLVPSLASLAQSQPGGNNTSSLCTRNSALDLIRQQIEVSKTISDPVQRIAVLTRAADLLWIVQEDKARAGFTEAFEVASQYEKEFLYLTAYPFALSYGGDMPVFSWYQLPSSFVINPAIRRQFVQTLLYRAQQALEVPLDEGDNFNHVSGAVHIWQVLKRIEAPVRDSLPDLVEAVVQAKDRIFVSSSQEIQQLYVQPERITDNAAKKTFAEQIEETLKSADPNKREESIVQTILSLSENERADVVLSAIDKIDDSTIRGTLKDWVYFNRANLAIKEKRFDEAESLVSKIDGLEQRAFLHSEIARGLFSTSETHAHAREMLDEAIVEAKKAGPNVFAASILLTASNLYSSADLQRSILVLGEAVNYLNQIEDPDFSTNERAISNRPNPGMKEIKGKNYRRVVHFYMPGLDPEGAFREMAKSDFDDAFSQTTSFTNKFLRATTMLTVADVCLQRLPRKTTR